MFKEKSAQGIRSLKKYIKTVTSVLSCSLILDRDARILYYSDNLIKLLGIKDGSQFLGMPLIEACELLGEDFVQRVSRRLSRVMSGEDEFFEEDTVSWPNGEKRLCRIIYKRMMDENNKFDHILLAAFDITDLRLTEKERHIEELLQTTVLPCFVWDQHGVMLAYNKEAARVFRVLENLPPEDFHKIFLSVQPKFQPDGSVSETIRQKVITEALEKGFAQLNVQLGKSDGTLIYFMVSVARISWAFDYRLIVYFYDTTDMMLKEIEAKQAEERMRLMLDANPLMCILRDDQGNIVDCNQAALNVLEVSSKEVFCRDFYSFFPEFQPDGVRSVDKVEEMIKVLSEKNTLTMERTFLSPTGKMIPVESKIVRIPWKDTHYYLSFSRDLREVKANERKMLEITKRERKAKLQKEAAQAANEAKNQFLANMSHEIRTPMNAILGMSELLLQGKLDKRQFRYAESIKTSTVALLNIINDILDVSKLQAGKLNLIPVHYDFNAFIYNICSTAQFLIKSKDIVFELIMQEQTPICLYGDDMRLRQVLLNLLGNAIKFTDEGAVRLAVSFTDSTIKMTVSDTGIGIPAENLPTLFDAFEQVNVEKNRTIKGTGLGLTISKLIVETMGGQIAVESVLGQGTSFHVEIPKILGDAALIYHADDKKDQIFAPDVKVLIVDDNEVNLTVAFELLRLYDIAPETATSGKEAIELIKQNPYDFVLMDHMMPEMDGIEATKIVRKMGISIPIIALTANAVSGVKEMMLKAGMNDYLSKPIIRAELTNIIKKWTPPEKLLESPSETTAPGKSKEYNELWARLEQIEGLSVSTGLDRVDEQREIYEKMLKLMIQEIEKACKNLDKFLRENDMNGFYIEAHGIKGALANIGAMELSEKAFDLEVASGEKDTAFCAENLPPLLERLNGLRLSLKEAFSVISNDGPFTIPPELPCIFERLIDAFAEVDLILIDKEIENMNALNLNDGLREEIEKIKDLVMMMNYAEATELIHKLLDNTQRLSTVN